MRKLHTDKDYRHIICSAITFVSLLFGFLFPNAIPRLLESLRDLGTSLAFYFYELIAPESNPIPPTVNLLPSWQLAPELWRPVTLLPETWEQFTQFWSNYLSLLFDKYNFLFYWYAVSDFLFSLSRLLLFLMPLGLVGIMLLSSGSDKTCTERGKKSRALIRFEKFLFKRVYPAVDWFKAFVVFLKKNSVYYKSWFALWALYFNLYSIGISFVGYYFYLVSSWNLLSVYVQLLKLQRDMTPVIRFLPGIVWFVIFAKIYNSACCSRALKTLCDAEKANRAVANQSSIITSVYGEPNLGKTLTITSMALTAQTKLFDDAFQIMINRATQFPNFPWQNFRDHLKLLIDYRVICDINQAKRFIASRRHCYDSIVKYLTPAQLDRLARKRPEVWPYIWSFYYGYDYTHYRSTYNDELKVIHLYDALESYAAAYLVFSVQTNLLFSNYSIRTDSLIKDIGNLPLRDNDFFDRDPALQEVYSQHSHIIDFDVLRLGRKIIEGNEKANGAPVGVIVVSEIDKEFKNMNLLKETKINTNETNQKNDLHDAALMMIRHGVVIDGVPFVVILADLQRPEAWGAGGRELGNVIFIPEKLPLIPVLPFFSTYWLTEGVFSWIKRKWDKFYTDFQYRRSDDTLPVYLARNLISMISTHYERLQNMFGMKIMPLDIQTGRMDGEVRQDRWHILSKKDFSNRYRTDCLASVYDKAHPNTMHIDDFITYAGALATKEECQLQNSYFQRDIHKMKENS